MDSEVIRRIRAIESLLSKEATLDTPTHYFPMLNFGTLGSGITANGTLCGATIHRQVRIFRYFVTCKVNTTNNTNNYWDIRLLTIPAGTLITSVNTSAMSTGIWTKLTQTSFTFLTPTSELGVYVDVLKVGSPGPLDIFCPLVGYYS